MDNFGYNARSANGESMERVMTPQEQYYTAPLGSVVGTQLRGFWQHVGILVPDDQYGFNRSVRSFAREGIIRQPVAKFARDKNFSSVNFLGKLHWEEVVWRAETAVVNRPYHATDFNCDFFVRYCHGVKMESPQAQTTVAFGLFLAAATIAVAASR